MGALPEEMHWLDEDRDPTEAAVVRSLGRPSRRPVRR